jgi:nucleotide-binding universal stress UspA family protein
LESVRRRKEEDTMKVLVALDGSKFAEAVLPSVALLAAETGCAIALVTVIKESAVRGTWRVPLEPPVVPIDISGGRVPAIEPRVMLAVETATQAAQRVADEAREYLSDIARRSFPGAQIDVLFGEDVAGELLAYAERTGVDIIAIATHGRTGLARLLMGSVATRLVQNGKFPVLLVRPTSLPKAE